jgi:putative ATP-dependent endonuclease of the OLD family
MYLAEMKLWNFRKYGSENGEPGLIVMFNNGLNLLVGENDSGKTAIIDAIKYILGTQSNDINRVSEKDFFKRADGIRQRNLKIECIFKGISPAEGAHFLEWLTFGDENKYELRVRLDSKWTENRIVTDIRAGIDGADLQLDGDARELLRTTYLKPLRDAENELTPGYRSRLAQILKSHHLFKIDKEEDHPLVHFIKEANRQVEQYFSDDAITLKQEDGTDGQTINVTGKQLSNDLNKYLTEFFPEGSNNTATFNISSVELSDILRKLSLLIDENQSGLGTLNLLFIATELLLLQNADYQGLKLALVEEIEAHLHPQAQLRLIDFLQSTETKGQFILSTHSTTLASTIKLEHLIVCRDSKVFPMGTAHTKLAKSDYRFLERFLDATKANLFFARGVILVEGDAENILLPIIADILRKPLHKYGVSIVNVGSTAFLRYSRIFSRQNGSSMNIPVAVITDLDVRPIEYYIDHGNEISTKVYCINDSNIEELQSQFPEISFAAIKDEVFKSKSAFEEALQTIKLTKRAPIGFKNYCVEKCQFDINMEFIESIRLKKHESKRRSFTQDKVEAFISSKWTLEYDFALSDLRDYIFKAVWATRIEKDSGEIEFNDEVFYEQIETELRERKRYWEENGHTPQDIAYEIYKPLLKGSLSKAINAQYLAHLLYKNKESVREILERDEHLNYLVEAIHYVTNTTGTLGGE